MKIKKHFITGLVFLLPIAIALGFMVFIINLLTDPFLNFITPNLSNSTWYQNHKVVFEFLLQILLLVIFFILTVILGFLTRVVLFNSLVSLYESIFQRIPVIKTIYKATKQVMQTVFQAQSQSFRQVVIVPFPEGKTGHSIGFVNGEAPEECSTIIGEKLITVFVPTAPNPTSGFLIMFKETEIQYLNIKVEDAFKFIISCGMVTPSANSPLTQNNKEEDRS